MNPLPPNADELVSAYLDGQAAPDEVVTVESSPELLPRVEELRAVSSALAAPMAAPPAQKDRQLGAALDLFDQLVGEGEFPNATGQSVAGGVANAGNTAPDESAPLDDSVADAPVVSLQSARERRRPRRFNSGVIAAAAAALLLVVGLAALDFGRGTSSDDVAGSESEAVAAADSAADSGDGSADTALMDTDEAMDDTESDSVATAGSDRAAEPRPESLAQAPPAADAAEDALDDADQAGDAENSALEMEVAEEDSATADSAPADEAETFAAEAEPPQYDPFLGEYADVDELVDELDALADDELLARAAALEPGLFPGCQPDVAELRTVDSLTLVGQALIDGRPVEVHAFDPGRAGRSAVVVLDVIVVDAGDCSLVITIE